ncbi:MAG: hypothetical protein Q7S70_00440 [bacterium]|nr:hypothetical protein [bacterium]
METFKRLWDISNRPIDLLTLRCTRAWLSNEGERVLYLKMGENPEVLTTSRERKAHHKEARAYSTKWFRSQLEKWKAGTQSVEIATLEHPLETITGDMCLILAIEGVDYEVNIHRDIFPIGWLLPGGCPKNLGEVFDPRATAIRKGIEEVLIADSDGDVYCFDPEGKTVADYKVWGMKSSKVVLATPRDFLPPDKGDAQSIVIEMDGERHEKHKIQMAVQVDPDIGSIQSTIYRRVELPMRLSELRLFDGEVNGKKIPLNRPVRLRTQDRRVSMIFVSGQDVLNDGWITDRTRYQSLFE